MRDVGRLRGASVVLTSHTMLALAILVAGSLLQACGANTVPRHYLKQAESGVTLTALSKTPTAYHGKVVILGGVIVEHKSKDDHIWLYLRNRPLDEDYVPHIPVTKEGPEAGHYWVKVAHREIPKDYQHWARVTVVGRVMTETNAQGLHATGEEIVLSALYIKGWDKKWGGYLQEDDAVGNVRPPVQPKPLQKNSGF